MGVLFIFGVIVAFVAYWLGRGVLLNQMNAAREVADDNPELAPDSLINLETGEIIEPGTRKYKRAVQKKAVYFE